jgi:hypothetical protein
LLKIKGDIMKDGNLMAVYDYNGKKSEVIREGTEYTVNFYSGDTWTHSTKFKVYGEALSVAEHYAEVGARFLRD